MSCFSKDGKFFVLCTPVIKHADGFDKYSKYIHIFAVRTQIFIYSRAVICIQSDTHITFLGSSDSIHEAGFDAYITGYGMNVIKMSFRFNIQFYLMLVYLFITFNLSFFWQNLDDKPQSIN